MILTFPRSACAGLLTANIVPWSGEPAITPHWLDRSHAETDPSWLQVIPYAVLIDLNDRPWAYRRTGGDTRLRERRSIGVGGHIEECDRRKGLLATMREALLRELAEELAWFPPLMSATAPPIAWINEQDSTVGRVHLGLVIAIPWGRPELPEARPGEGLEGLDFVPASAVTEALGYERWSVLAAQSLAIGTP
jgi:predicted NUDIX family phosphoesterase